MTTLDPTRNGGQLDSLAWSRFLLESRATEQVETDSALEAILDCVAVPVWVLDHEGLVLLANPAALDVLGFDELSELQGRHGHDAVTRIACPAEDCPLLEPAARAFPCTATRTGSSGATGPCSPSPSRPCRSTSPRDAAS